MKKIMILLLTLLSACSMYSQSPAPVLIAAPSASTADTPTAKANTTTSTNLLPTPVIAPYPSSTAKITVSNNQTPASNQLKYVSMYGAKWLRPTAGSIVTGFSIKTKGVNITAPVGQAIVAAQDGKVVYSGNGLPSYGNLLIIKHSNNFLTAYSHNQQNLVHEGEMVTQGQKIATVGKLVIAKTHTDQSLLHFELRQKGLPLDPSALFQ